MPNISASVTPPRFITTLAVETFKLRRSLALWLALVAPLLVAIFVFFNLIRSGKPASWAMTLQMSSAIWAFFMLPMSIIALTALLAQTEHAARTWEYLRALPRPRWQLYAAKVVCALAVVMMMQLLLAALTPLAVLTAGWVKPSVAASGTPDMVIYLQLLGRIFLASWLLVAVQLWVALRYISFVPALTLGIAGTFFAVVATSAKAGIWMPWQIPVNQLASDPARADLTLLLGCVGGGLVFVLMLWRLSRQESPI